MDGSACSHTMTGLGSGVTYWMRMRARNADGWGEKSGPLAEATTTANSA